MRRRLLLLLLAAAAVGTSSAFAAWGPLQERAYEVRGGIPPAIAYYYDNGFTWRGMTVAKLKRYDRELKNIVIRNATKKGFCILTTKRPLVHFDGPRGKVRRGRCGERGAIVPYVPRPGSEPPPQTTAQKRIRNAVPSIEAYNVDHDGYAGMTVAAIRRYDSSITDVRIVRATRATYCIESGTGTGQYYKNGPGAEITRGECRVR
jgi:hypothetical protein